MGKYNFKDKYYNHLGVDVANIYNTYFFSVISPSGDGSRESPYSITQNTQKGGNNDAFIIGRGVLDSTFYLGGYPANPNVLFVGSGIKHTIFDGCSIVRASNNTNGGTWLFKDLTLNKLTITDNYKGMNVIIYRCDITKLFFPSPILNIYNCIIRVNGYSGNNNSYLGVDGKLLINANLNLFDQCNVIINKTDIDKYKNNYLAFNNCNLKIGDEIEYKPLIGSTETELRDDFVRRCTIQSISVPDIADYNEILPAGRWIFSSDSCIEGRVIKDSVIHNFEKRRHIYFGYTDTRTEKLSIVSDNNIPGSFCPVLLDNKLNITNNTISLNSSLNLAETNKMFSDSKIIWLEGKYKLDILDIVHNLPMVYGLGLDGTNTLSTMPVSKGSIEIGKTYLVRSSNKESATITYNNLTYNTSLLGRNNVFRGIINNPTFSGSDNAEVYEILDEVMHQTIQLRIVNKLPSQEITSGNLQPDYWYFVDYKDSAKKDGAIVYDGISYGATDSFVAKAGVLNYTPHANLKLRRCWHKDFEFKDGIPDYDFWKSEQKPQWIDILPEDPRCLMEKNSNVSLEIQKDEQGNYIGSGHPDFYNSIIGNSGIRLPAYPIKGAYMQIRLVISTLNPM